MSTVDRETTSDCMTTYRLDSGFVVADPHVVYYDAVMHSPWDHDGGGHLPQRGDWSTYRYAVKDIILGVATHRFNKNTRRLEIRAYFVGEHPIFKEMEPTKAMMIVFCCQSYQSGGTLELLFEHGIPFDVRELIERSLGVVISGHSRVIESEVAKQLFAALSDFEPDMQKRILAQDRGFRSDFMEKVCYNTYRGTWSPGHIKSLVQRGVPLRWLFERKLNQIGNPALNAHLNNHLCAVLLEEYAVRRLEDRPLGMSLGKRIIRRDEANTVYYRCDDDLLLDDAENHVHITAGSDFCLLPVVPRSVGYMYWGLEGVLDRARGVAAAGVPVLVMPMDFVYLPESYKALFADRVRAEKFQMITVEQTVTQLLSEAEFNLAVTAAQADDAEVESVNVDRYAD
jgi:hypothetical protein